MDIQSPHTIVSGLDGCFFGFRRVGSISGRGGGDRGDDHPTCYRRIDSAFATLVATSRTASGRPSFVNTHALFFEVLTIT